MTREGHAAKCREWRAKNREHLRQYNRAKYGAKREEIRRRKAEMEASLGTTLSAIQWDRERAEKRALQAAAEAKERRSEERRARELAKRERLLREMAQIEWRG
jgi:hypothetical protein